jgi:hypothetical protein
MTFSSWADLWDSYCSTASSRAVLAVRIASSKVTQRTSKPLRTASESSATERVRRNCSRPVEEVYIQSILVETKMVHLAQVEGQIEYALMAGFVAVAAGAIMPNVANSISTILSEVASV